VISDQKKKEDVQSVLRC